MNCWLISTANLQWSASRLMSSADGAVTESKTMTK